MLRQHSIIKIESFASLDFRKQQLLKFDWIYNSCSTKIIWQLKTFGFLFNLWFALWTMWHLSKTTGYTMGKHCVHSKVWWPLVRICLPSSTGRNLLYVSYSGSSNSGSCAGGLSWTTITLPSGSSDQVDDYYKQEQWERWMHPPFVALRMRSGSS